SIPDPDPDPQPDPDPDPDPITPLPPCHYDINGGIIDDRDTACFTLNGPSQYWRMVETGYGNRLYWTKAYGGSGTTNWAAWKFQVTQPEHYRIEVYNVPTYGTSKNAHFELLYDGQVHQIRVNLNNHNGWFSLVEMDLAPGKQVE